MYKIMHFITLKIFLIGSSGGLGVSHQVTSISKHYLNFPSFVPTHFLLAQLVLGAEFEKCGVALQI